MFELSISRGEIEIMKVNRVIFAILATTMVISGCSHSNNKAGKGKKNPLPSENEVNFATASVVPTVCPQTVSPSVDPVKDQEKREDEPVEYVDANYFKEKVKDIIYYRDGKKYTISPATEQGKQIVLMTKMRYVNTGEHVLRKNKLKKRFSSLQKKGKALEIKFAKSSYKIYTGGKSNDYKKVSINYQSWFYPLEGEESEYFLPLPNKECTYERLGDAKQLLEYLEENIK